jgi:hypothetical protein
VLPVSTTLVSGPIDLGGSSEPSFPSFNPRPARLSGEAVKPGSTRACRGRELDLSTPSLDLGTNTKLKEALPCINCGRRSRSYLGYRNQCSDQ